MGLDLGQVRDYTALAILGHVEFWKKTTETNEREHLEKREHEWHLGHVDRLPLGTSYQDVAKHIKSIIRQFEHEGRGITLIVDATGVGRPVIDSLKEEGLKPVPVTITPGLNVSYSDGEWHVPKRDLISAAIVMLGKKELRIAPGIKYKDTLIRELQNFQVEINVATGHDSYAAWREGEHDDLVLSLALACWWALRKKGNTLSMDASEAMTNTAEGATHPEDDYRIGWVPARDEEYGALAVYNVNHSSVVHFERIKSESIKQQIDHVFKTAQRYDAVVWAQAGTDEAILKTLVRRGAPVKRVDMTEQDWTSAYENLSLLASYEQIKLPNDPELLSELEVGESSSIWALCLVTYDIHPEIAAATHRLDDEDDAIDYEGEGVHSWLRGIHDEGYYDREDFGDYDY
ncbi:MAG: hypothetical protein WBZ42_04805 [Halobacteriota archaeon]